MSKQSPNPQDARAGGDPGIDITSPSSGEEVSPPFTVTGTFECDGDTRIVVTYCPDNDPSHCTEVEATIDDDGTWTADFPDTVGTSDRGTITAELTCSGQPFDDE